MTTRARAAASAAPESGAPTNWPLVATPVPEDADHPDSVIPGDAEAFERLFLAYFDPLCRFVRGYVESRETAQDLVEDVFLQVWLRLPSLEQHRGLKAYLFTTARHHAISYLRRQQVELRHQRRLLVEEMGRDGPTLPTVADEQLAADELTAAVQRAVDALPPRQREVILLKWERQATREEIARALGIAPKTVAEHFRRALGQLRAALRRDPEAEVDYL